VIGSARGWFIEREGGRDPRRLVAMIREALVEPKVRSKTKPTRASRERRLETKTRNARTKRLRGRQRIDD
jgi:ribosome-associated protein